MCRQVGIAPDRCFARLLPQQKCDWIRSAQSQSQTGPPRETKTPRADLDVVANTGAETETVGPDLEQATTEAETASRSAPWPSSASTVPPRGQKVLMIGDGILE